MADKRFTWEFGLNADDMRSALKEIITAVNAVDNTLKEFSKTIQASFGGVKAGAAAATTETTKFNQSLKKSFSDLNKDIETINKNIRQADMTKWEKAADNYGTKLEAARKTLENLTRESEKLTLTEEERERVNKRLVDAQEKVNKLQQAQAGASALAQQKKDAQELARIEKERADQQKKAAAEAAKAAREAAAEQKKAASEAARAAKQAAAEQARAAADAQKALDSISAAMDKAAQEQLRAVEKYERGLDKAFNTIGKDIENITKSMRQADMSRWEKMADNYAMKLQKGKDAIEELRKKAQDLNATEEQRIAINEKIARAQERLIDLEKRQGEAVALAKQKDAAEATRKAYADLRGAMQEIGMIGAAVSGVTIGLIASSAKEFADFESKLTAFKAVSGATAEEVGKFKELARDMSQFGKSSTEVAALGVEFAKAGLSAAEIEKAVKSVTVASVATQESLQDVGMTVDAVRSQFGLTADDFDRVSNGLVLAANESKIGFNDLAESYKYVGSTAKNTNQSIETINALLVILGNEGIKASQAGNGLQNALLRLTDPKVRESLKKIGVDAVDANGNVRKFTDVIVDLQKSMRGMSQADTAAFLKKNFGEVALVPVLSLMSKTEKQIRETEKTMMNWGGAQDKVAKDMQKGLLYTFGQMQASVQVAKQVFIEQLAPALEVLAKVVKGAADAFTGLPKPLQWVVANGVLVVGALAAITTGVVALAFAANSGVTALGGMSGALMTLLGKAPAAAAGATGISAAVANIGGMAKLLPGLLASAGTALSGFVSGMTAVLAPFIALAGVLYGAWKYNLGGFRDIMLPFLDMFRITFEQMTGITLGFQEVWTVVWETTKDTLYAVVAVIDNVLRGLFTTIDVIFKMIADAVFGNWSSLWETISGVTAAGANAVLKTFGSFFSKMQAMFDLAWRGAAEVVAGAWDIMTDPKNAANGIKRMEGGLNLIKKSFVGMGAVISESFRGTVAAVQTNAANLTQQGKNIINFNDEIEKRVQKAKGKPTAATAPAAQAPTKSIDLNGDKAKKDKEAQDKELAQLDDFIQKIFEKYGTLEEQKKASLQSLSEIDKTAESAFITMPTLLLESAKITEQAAQTTGQCYAAFARALQKAEENAGILDKTGKVLQDQKSIWADIRDSEKAAAYMFKSVADRAVQRGILEKYQPKNLGEIQEGGIVVFPQNYLPGHGAGHIGTTGKGGVEYSDVTNAVLQRAPQLLNVASFYRFTGGVDSKKKQELEKAITDLNNQMIAELEKGMDIFKSDAALKKLADTINNVKKKSASEAIKMSAEARKEQEKNLQIQIDSAAKFLDEFGKMIDDKTKSITDSLKAITGEAFKASIGAANTSLFNLFEQIKNSDETLFNLNAKLKAASEALAELQDSAGGNATPQQQAQINQLLATEVQLRKEALGYQEAMYGVTKDNKKALDEEAARQKEMGEIEKQRAALREQLFTATSQKERKQIYATLDMMQIRYEELNKASKESQGLLTAQIIQGAGEMFDATNEAMIKQTKAAQDRYRALIGDQDKLSKLARDYNIDELAASMQLTDYQKEQLDLLLKITRQEDIRAAKSRISAKEAENLKNQLSTAAGLVTAFTSGFGEIGSFLGQAAGFVSETGSAFADIGKASADITAGGGVADLAALFADPTGATALLTIAKKGLELIGQALGDAFKAIGGNEKFYSDMFNRRANIAREKEIELQKDLIEIRRQAGKLTLDDEIELINQEADLTQARIFQRYQDLKRTGPKGTGFLGMQTLDDIQAYRTELEGLEKEQFDNAIKRQRDSQEARIRDVERTRERLYSIDDMYYERQSMLAEQTADKLDDIDADFYQSRYEIFREFEDAKRESPDLAYELELTRNAKLVALDKRIAQERLEARAEAEKEAIEARYAHLEAVLAIEGQTWESSLKAQELARDKEAALIEQDMRLYAANSLEYQRLEQQKADAVNKANAEIAKSIAAMRREREVELRNLSIGIRQLQAEITENAAGLFEAGAQQGFFDIAEEENSRIADAREKYENAEEVVTQIRLFYAKKRERETKRIFDEGLQAFREAYGKDQQKLLDRQTAPLNQIISKEEKRIKAIQTQNAELERQNALIDERFNKEQERFDLEDQRMFRQSLAGVDLTGGLQAGIEYLANESVINGTVIDRSSRESQLRGLSELLDIQQQDAESKLKLEEISQEAYNAELIRITLMRAKVTQEQLADVENEKEKSDLTAKFAELYTTYQKQQKEAIEDRRKAETKANDDTILSNNRLRSEAEATINFQKAKIDELKLAYDEKMTAIDAKLSQASMTTNGWLDSLSKIAPTLATQVQSAISSIAQIRNEFGKPITLNVQGTSSTGGQTMTEAGSLITSGGYAQSSTVQSRDRKMVDAYGSFSIQGPDGRWYLSTTQMEAANLINKTLPNIIGGLRGYAEGGVIPDQFTNDSAIIRASAGERVLQAGFNKRMENMLNFFEAPRGGFGGQSVNINVDVSSDVDLAKLETVFDKHLRKRETLGVRKWGINSISRN